MSTGEELDGERLLEGYFKELEEALSALPRDRRDQLIDEIGEHVNNAIALKRPRSAWELRELLQKVGSPKQIAAAALEEEGPHRPKRRGSLPLVVAGSILLAGMGLTIGLLASTVAPARASLGAPPATTKKSAMPSEVSTTTTVPSSSTTTTVPPPTTTTTGSSAGSPIANGSARTVTTQELPLVASCEQGVAPASEPALIFFGCATSATLVDTITWTSWTATSATGYGTLRVNQCNPTCAAGTYDTYPATIRLTNPSITVANQPLFQNITVVTNLTGPVETGSDPTADWGFVPTG
jgi:HAAS domain-containing protein